MKFTNIATGAHAVTARRRSLLSQYHFHCCCIACVSEGDDSGEDKGLLSKTDKELLNYGGKGVDKKGGGAGGGLGGGKGSGGGGAESDDPLEEEIRYLATTIGDIQAQVNCISNRNLTLNKANPTILPPGG